MTSNIFEGLKAGDLTELVLPLISIDEYDSKLDDDSLVIGFYVQDKEPAQDLNRFIQKGAVNILDTDVSPAPNEDGYYMVFVELLRDDNSPSKIINILETLDSLADLTKWRGMFYGQAGSLEVTEDSIRQFVRLDSAEDHESHDDEVEESIKEWFLGSDLEDLIVEGKTVTLRGSIVDVVLEMVDFGEFDVIRERNAVLSQALRIDEAAQRNTRRLHAMLGDRWLIEHIQNHVVLSNTDTTEVGLFKI